MIKLIVCLFSCCLVSLPFRAQGGAHHNHSATRLINTNRSAKPFVPRLPSLPPGIEQLKFGEFYQSPIGSHGLTPSKRLQELRGKKVRILGFMVEQASYARDYFLMTAVPLSLDEEHFSNDLPPASLLVKLKPGANEKVVFSPYPLLLTGTLEIGHAEETDGRTSHLRLVLDKRATHRTPYNFPKGKNQHPKR